MRFCENPQGDLQVRANTVSSVWRLIGRERSTIKQKKKRRKKEEAI